MLSMGKRMDGSGLIIGSSFLLAFLVREGLLPYVFAES
jgi:hypothetical protein